MDKEVIKKASELIRTSKYGVAFTGAGISVDSGIPAFRGSDGLWSSVDPIYFELDFFKKKPFQSWTKIKELFYEKLVGIDPNVSHNMLAAMEKRGFIESVITQNIDHLHQKSGSKYVYELHGTYKQIVCTECQSEYDMSFVDLNFLPPTCFVCKGILKPDIVFFNEAIPTFALTRSKSEAEKSDVFLIIGTKGEVYPANSIPIVAKDNGATIIEINTVESHYTETITDIFLKGKASDIMKIMGEFLYL